MGRIKTQSRIGLYEILLFPLYWICGSMFHFATIIVELGHRASYDCSMLNSLPPFMITNYMLANIVNHTYEPAVRQDHKHIDHQLLCLYNQYTGNDECSKHLGTQGYYIRYG